MRVIFLLLFLLVGCASYEQAGEKVGQAFYKAAKGTVVSTGKVINTTADIIGIELPEDPRDVVNSRRWQLCVAHPCEYKEQCARFYPGAFMSPSCKVAKRQGREPRVFGPQRPADNATNSELYRIIKRQCPDEKGETARWECIAEFFDEEEIPK